MDKFYLFHLRRALIFAQRKLQTNFFHEKQSSGKSLSQILIKKKFGQLFCSHWSTFLWKKQTFLGTRYCQSKHFSVSNDEEMDGLTDQPTCVITCTQLKRLDLQIETEILAHYKEAPLMICWLLHLPLLVPEPSSTLPPSPQSLTWLSTRSSAFNYMERVSTLSYVKSKHGRKCLQNSRAPT